VTIRAASTADERLLHELWDEFQAEVPDPPELQEAWDDEWADTRKDIADGLVLVAEDEAGAAGYVRLRMQKGATWHIASAYVRPRARRLGVLRMLLQEAVREGRERGSERITLHVLVANAVGTTTWQSLGFAPVSQYLAQPLDALERRLALPAGETFGSIHLQTDDRPAVLRAVEKHRPRMTGPGGTEVSDARNGWVTVYDEVCERDVQLLKRFAKELSHAVGAVVVTVWVEQGAVVGYSMLDHGSAVDDYVSVPEFHGPLPPGDVVSLEPNPRVVQRLTGADPGVVRAVARTARSPAELPPARELVAQVAATMGIVDADRGYRG
jgi:ribosomal protein S18 acetylase RimI-like enzyme